VNFQSVILTLHQLWGDRGCAIAQPYNIEKGTGPMLGKTAAHPAILLLSSESSERSLMPDSEIRSGFR